MSQGQVSIALRFLCWEVGWCINFSRREPPIICSRRAKKRDCIPPSATAEQTTSADILRGLALLLAAWLYFMYFSRQDFGH